MIRHFGWGGGLTRVIPPNLQRSAARQRFPDQGDVVAGEVQISEQGHAVQTLNHGDVVVS